MHLEGLLLPPRRRRAGAGHSRPAVRHVRRVSGCAHLRIARVHAGAVSRDGNECIRALQAPAENVIRIISEVIDSRRNLLDFQVTLVQCGGSGWRGTGYWTDWTGLQLYSDESPVTVTFDHHQSPSPDDQDPAYSQNYIQMRGASRVT